MKSFLQWCEEHKLNLEDIVKEVPDSKETTSEAGATKRAMVRSHAYPDAYGRAQYPDSYFRPTAADAAYYQSKD